MLTYQLSVAHDSIYIYRCQFAPVWIAWAWLMFCINIPGSTWSCVYYGRTFHDFDGPLTSEDFNQFDEQRHHQLRTANRFTRNFWAEKTRKSLRIRARKCTAQAEGDTGFGHVAVLPCFVFQRLPFHAMVHLKRDHQGVHENCFIIVLINCSCPDNTRSGTYCSCLIPWMFCRTWFKLDDGFQSQSSAHDLCVFAEVLVMFDAQHWPFRSHMQGLTRYF